MKRTLPKIGAHVSAAGGVFRAIANARAIGAEALQIFGASPRQWVTRMPTAEDATKFKAARKEADVGPVFLHAAYLPNIATQDARQLALSVKNLSEHLEIAEMIGAEGLIFHLGSGKEAPKEQAMEKAISAMRQILARVPGRSLLVMENSAGGGAKLGSSPQDLGILLRAVGEKRLKVCIDTAHAFAAGVIESYSPQGVKKFVDELDRTVGLRHIVALHVNDSKAPHGSRRDLHENIGDGTIGLLGFQNIAKEKRLWDKAWILEVPGFAGEGPDRKNVERLKSCFS